MARRSKSKYQLPSRRRSSGSGRWLGWLLVVILAGVGVWFWWPAAPVKFPVAVRAKPVVSAAPVVKKIPPALLVVPPPKFLPPVVVSPPVVVAPSPARVVPPVASPAAPAGFPHPVMNPLEAQVALARLGISAGSIDGAIGSQTRQALRQFQQQNHLPGTGVLDAATRSLLTLEAAPMTTYTVTAGDLARLQPIGKTWLEKSEQTALDYESEVELVGEFCHAHPSLIRQLNPQINWANLAPGTLLRIPDAHYPDPADKAAWVIIHLSGKYLEAYDEATNLLLHCPCSIAAHVEKRPVGLLHVVVVAPHPNYTFDPAVFPESPEARALGRKLILPPGPNNPVGVAWMGLDRPGYGMHGTPVPEQVGRTESHGCFRLANWDAEYLVKLVWVGLPVQVVP